MACSSTTIIAHPGGADPPDAANGTGSGDHRDDRTGIRKIDQADEHNIPYGDRNSSRAENQHCRRNKT
jgi:hypothetical protein